MIKNPEIIKNRAPLKKIIDEIKTNVEMLTQL